MSLPKPVQSEIEKHLHAIEKVFKSGSLVTLIVRHPTISDSEVVLSLDSLKEVVKLLNEKIQEGAE